MVKFKGVPFLIILMVNIVAIFVKDQPRK